MAETPCIQCGQPVGELPRWNHLPNGLPCPACRDRLLEALPALLPGGVGEEEEERHDPPTGFHPRLLVGRGANSSEDEESEGSHEDDPA